MKRTFSGAASGKGAIYAWEGNKKVGKGSMEITEASPAKIAIKLDFIEPFEGHNVTEFTLEPKGRFDHAHLDDVRPGESHDQGDAGVRQHGRDGRQGLRGGSRQPQDHRRKVRRNDAAPEPIMTVAAGRSVEHGTFTIVREFAHPPARVFAAWADPSGADSLAALNGGYHVAFATGALFAAAAALRLLRAAGSEGVHAGGAGADDSRGGRQDTHQRGGSAAARAG